MFGIFTEWRESLAELEATTVKILSAVSSQRYFEKEILNQIDFVMMDSTSYNLKVIKLICKKIEVKKSPGTLLWNIHALMMLYGLFKELHQKIRDSLGKKKLVNFSLLMWSSWKCH